MSLNLGVYTVIWYENLNDIYYSSKDTKNKPLQLFPHSVVL
jgi:hypothetical protein